MKNRLDIFKIWVDPVTKDEAIARVKSFLENGQRAHSILASNPEKNFTVPRDPKVWGCLECSDLLLPDGVGVVLAAYIIHGVVLKRIPGSEFIFDICKLADQDRRKVFIYGAKEEINKAATAKLAMQYPGMQIVGRANGYIDEEHMAELIKEINQSQAEILFVAIGSPNQEKWVSDFKDELEHVKVVQCIGGTLDTIVGNVQRAPEIWRTHCVEWLYRLIKQPTRIKRQFVLPIFLGMIFIERVRIIARRLILRF
jgi:N-acetylglucosaminyldiphosphoundecaprenol N-acetyl-beta-D-mannosaminyltransferase